MHSIHIMINAWRAHYGAIFNIRESSTLSISSQWNTETLGTPSSLKRTLGVPFSGIALDSSHEIYTCFELCTDSNF